MNDDTRGAQTARLTTRMDVALVKFDRLLAELERIGDLRIRPLAEAMAVFDLYGLKSVVADLEAAQRDYAAAAADLRRIG